MLPFFFSPHFHSSNPSRPRWLAPFYSISTNSVDTFVSLAYNLQQEGVKHMRFYLTAIMAAALFAPLAATAADDTDAKELAKLASWPSIKKQCGDFFAITTYRDPKPNAQQFLLYRPEGKTSDEVKPMKDMAPFEINEMLKKPTIEELPNWQMLFRMNSTDAKDATQCGLQQAPTPTAPPAPK
jgi:hypothetical protein